MFSTLQTIIKETAIKCYSIDLMIQMVRSKAEGLRFYVKPTCFIDVSPKAFFNPAVTGGVVFWR